VQLLSEQSKPSQRVRRKPVSTITEVSSEQTAGHQTTLSRERPLSDNNTAGGATIERIGAVWKSELSSDKSERGVPTIAAALATGPPVPPKEGRHAASRLAKASGRGRLAEASQPLASKVTSVSPGDAARSQPASLEDVNASVGRPSRPRTLTGSTLQAQSDADGLSQDKADSERSHDPYAAGSTFTPSEHYDDFGPQSPPSDFTWSYSDAGRELVPSDSASQRPPRSDYEGSERHYSVRSAGGSAEDAAAAHAAALRLQAETAASPSDEDQTSEERAVTPPDASTPAQAVRESADVVLAEYTAHLLDTVIEETQSQAQSFAGRSRATTRRSSGMRSAFIAGEIQEEEELRTPSPRKHARSVKSQASSSGQTTGSVGSQDVARLLEYLETQQTERQARDAVLEEQIRGFQDAITSLQRKETGSSKRSARRSSTTSTGEASLRSAARDAELAAVQEKLDRVLNLVGNVFEGQARLEREAKERDTTVLATPSVVASPPPQDLSRIEDTLQTLLKRMQTPDVSSLSGAASSSSLRGGLPAVLDPANRARFLERGNVNMREMSSRDRAILADRLVGRVTRGRSSAPAAVEADATPRSFVSQWTRTVASPGLADLGTPGMSASISDSDLLTLDDRIPPRSWISAEGVPCPPPNTDNASLLSRDGGSRPSRDLFFGVPGSSSRAAPRAAFAPDASPVSLDMEAEVRRRRGRHPETAVHGGGFFTPRTASGAPQAPEVRLVWSAAALHLLTFPRP
jgi:hypothetical protein